METTQFPMAPIQKMELAARNIDKSLVIDSTAPSLLELMNIRPPQVTTASGLTDHDYPVLSGTPFALNNMLQIKNTSKVPLPTEIVEHFNHIQCHCMMGLFPEIGRAWLTVDSDIYVWSYEDNSDLAYFDGINETILSVGLIKPRAGVFHAFIKHLLVLTTAVDIIVLGVTFMTGPNGPLDEIQLIPDPVFTIPTDGSTISAIGSTALGRLFLGSKDGCLFEIVYQAESGWFGKRCKKINHSTSALSFLVPSFINAALNEEDGIVQIAVDNSRGILYVLTEKGSIEVYDLGARGDSFGKVTKVSQSTLVNQAVNIVKTLDSQNFRPIVSISAVESSESNNIYLVATTQTGVRFYMTTHTLVNTPQNQRPYTLYLLHVRLPPGYSANITVRPRAVHISHYSDRNLLLLATVNEKDVLWCISSDLFPFSQHLMEAYTTISLDGPALALAEIPQEYPLSQLTTENAPLVTRQHSEPPKKYVALTSEGVYIFSKMRPVDILRQLITDSQGVSSDSVKAFFMMQKEDQACATSLIIASLDVDENVELAENATRAFFLYGGEPRLGALGPTNLFSGASPFAPNVISTPAHTLPLQQSTLQNPNPPYPSFDITSPFIFSSKHNGLYLYLGRILRPIWNRRCVEKISLDGKTVVNTSTVTSDHCRWILNYLITLNNFLLSNTQLAICDNLRQQLDSTLNTTQLNTTNRMNHTLQDAQIEERTSLSSLRLFVNQCCQIMGLWRILCEHQFHFLICSLPPNYPLMLQETTFKDLFLYGQDLCSLLINTLVDSYLGDNTSVDSISTKLREVCPQLYRAEDAAFSKANEMLKSSRVIQNVDEKEEMVMSALELCKSIAPNVNLEVVCRQFVSLKAYHAVIDLCIACAKKVDPNHVAEHFYKNDSSVSDQEGRDFYQKRMNVYKEVFNMLDVICTEAPTNLNVTTPSPLPAEGDVRLIVLRLISEILEYPDEILHVALYDWMMKKQMTSELIKIENSSLETYLIRTSQENQDNTAVVDLLWKYYENRNNHAAAAKILDNLAMKTGDGLTLRERLEYLTRAIMCMRSNKVGYAPYLGVFLRDLEDKLEVAKVQEQILEAVTSMRGSHPAAEEAIVALNSGLYQITQLYETFADPLELWECQLAIIDCAGYSDQNLVEKIWRNILKREIRKSTGSPDERMGQILAKVRFIARQCGISNQCFPTAFLISELEQLSTFLNADKTMVARAFASMDLKIDALIEIYNKLIVASSDIQIWRKEENEFHLFEAMAALIETFLDTHEEYSSVQKRTIISQCQDTVASLLVILYTKANTEDLINMLRGLQNRLSRI